MSRCGPPELRERRNFGVLGRRLSGFRAVGSPIPQLFVPAGEPLCRALRRRGGDCRYFVDRICPGILKVGWNALPLHCCPRRFLRCRRTIPAGGRRERVVRMSVGQSGGHRKSGQEDIGRVSGERQERMNTICNIDQRERKKRQGRAAAYCSSSREQMRSMRFREQQVVACNLLG